MARIKKPSYVSEVLYNYCKNEKNIKKSIKTKERSCTIIPLFEGFTIEVHTGNKYVPLLITDKMIGYKLGEFVDTRKIPKHPALKGVKKK